MEEEGIYYYFEHSDGNHQMVVSPTPLQATPPWRTSPTLIYEGMSGGKDDEDRDYAPGENPVVADRENPLLWDHCFELPHKHLDATTTIQSSVDVGTVSHNLQAGNNSSMELYDFPGHYAQRFDGVDPGGGDRASRRAKHLHG